MKRTLTLAAILFFLNSALSAGIACGPKDLPGEWKVEVKEAPYEYSRSTLTIAEKDGLLTGTVKFDTGYLVDVKTITLTGDSVLMEMYVEYNFVRVTGKMDGNVITGTADTPEGKMGLRAVKK